MSNKIALVFGGTRGIGAACVQKLAESGYDVAYTYVTSAPNLPAKIGSAKTKGYAVDICQPAQVAQVFADVTRDFGSAPHCVVANAGINVPPGPLAAVRPGELPQAGGSQHRRRLQCAERGGQERGGRRQHHRA